MDGIISLRALIQPSGSTSPPKKGEGGGEGGRAEEVGKGGVGPRHSCSTPGHHCLSHSLSYWLLLSS